MSLTDPASFQRADNAISEHQEHGMVFILPKPAEAASVRRMMSKLLMQVMRIATTGASQTQVLDELSAHQHHALVRARKLCEEHRVLERNMMEAEAALLDARDDSSESELLVVKIERIVLYATQVGELRAALRELRGRTDAAIAEYEGLVTRTHSQIESCHSLLAEIAAVTAPYLESVPGALEAPEAP